MWRRNRTGDLPRRQLRGSGLQMSWAGPRPPPRSPPQPFLPSVPSSAPSLTVLLHEPGRPRWFPNVSWKSGYKKAQDHGRLEEGAEGVGAGGMTQGWPDGRCRSRGGKQALEASGRKRHEARRAGGCARGPVFWGV